MKRCILFLVLLPVGAIASPNTESRTGAFKLTFSEASPLSSSDILIQRMDANGPGTDHSWLSRSSTNRACDVFVPQDYRPAVPYGLFVWTGVAPVPASWQPVFARRKLICVSAYSAGEQGLDYTPAMPLDAVHNIRKLYTIDTSRVYVSGFSAGAGLASSLLRAFPDVYKGGLFLLGGSFYTVYKKEDGTYDPTLDEQPPSWKGDISKIHEDVRIVLMRGGRDPLYVPRADRPQYDALMMDGFANVDFIVVPGLAHNLPDASWFDKGLLELDRPRATRENSQPGQPSLEVRQARRVFATAMTRVSYLKEYARKKHVSLAAAGEKNPNTITSARKYLRQVIEQYPDTPLASRARKVLDELDAGKSVL